jgi:hypothetical protein
MKGKKRRRMHGGAKGSGAQEGAGNGRYHHGCKTSETVELRRIARNILAAIDV